MCSFYEDIAIVVLLSCIGSMKNVMESQTHQLRLFCLWYLYEQRMASWTGELFVCKIDGSALFFFGRKLAFLTFPIRKILKKTFCKGKNGHKIVSRFFLFLKTKNNSNEWSEWNDWAKKRHHSNCSEGNESTECMQS